MKMKKGIIGIIFVFGIFLSLNFVFGAESSTTEVQFYNSFEYPFCYRESESVSWWVEDGVWQQSMNLDGVGCYNESGFPDKDCCPISASICKEDNGHYYCIDDGKLHCRDFIDPDICNQGHSGIAANDLDTERILGTEELGCGKSAGEYGENGLCINYIACKCQWIEEDNNCQSVSEHQIYVAGDVNTFYNSTAAPNDINDTCNAINMPDLGQCNFNFEITDNCETIGFLLRGWVATKIGITSEYCKDGNDRVPCLDVVKLSFFGVLGFISAVVLIIGIYWFFAKKKK